jgi:predicted ATPase
VQKSLIAADVSGPEPIYRLLDMTRAAVLAHLREGGDFREISLRHADYFRDMLETIERSWAAEPKSARIESYRRAVDNVRAGLAWSFSTEGDKSLARRLAIASIQLYRHLALPGEGLQWARAALAIIEEGPAGEAEELQLQTALGWFLFFNRGPVAECVAAFERSFALAELHENFEVQVRAITGLWAACFNRGQMTRAEELGARTRIIAEAMGDRVARIRATVAAALTDHMLGRQASARRQIEAALAEYDDACQRVDDLRLVHDQRSTLHSFHARILWMQGLPERAMAVVADDLRRENTRAHEETYGNALLHGLPVVAGCADWQRTAELAAMLVDTAQRYGLTRYGVWARAYQSMALVGEGASETNLGVLGGALAEVRRLPFGIYLAQLFPPYVLGLLKVGRVAEARLALGDASALSADAGEHWIRPELLRVDGEVVRHEAVLGASAAAESKFREAVDLAREQAALWWELRATTSLATLLESEGRPREAADMLANVLARFTEGFDTPDLIRARNLLDGMT